MNSRRKFLQIFGLGVFAAAGPASLSGTTINEKRASLGLSSVPKGSGVILEDHSAEIVRLVKEEYTMRDEWRAYMVYGRKLSCGSEDEFKERINAVCDRLEYLVGSYEN